MLLRVSGEEGLLALVRLWFVFKLLVDFSDFSSARAKRVCLMNNFAVNFFFCIKALMKKAPYGDLITNHLLGHQPVIGLFNLVFPQIYYNCLEKAVNGHAPVCLVLFH